MNIAEFYKILVVDDKPNNLSLATSLLRPHYDVYLANNGEKAIAMAVELRPHLILLDVMMPGLSGFEVCELLKQNEVTATIPVIFLTARNSGEDYEKAYELGGVDYITKPINAKELLARVKTHLLIRAQQEQLEQQNRQITAMNSNLEQAVNKRTVELKIAINKLEKRNIELEQASYVISHNLRGPVASIMGLCQIYNKANLADAANSGIIEHLFDTTTKLDEIIKDLVDIVSFRQQSVPAYESIVLDELLQEVMHDMENEILAHQAIISFDFTEVQPIFSAKSFVKDVLKELLLNAIKHRAKIQPLIRVNTQKQNNAVSISIMDNGMGIAQNHLSQVFFPFKRFSLETKGKGLGLYKVKNMVEALQGHIYLESNVGKGTTVTVVIPENT